MALVIKNPPANAGDIRDSGLVPGSGGSPEEGNGNPLLYSCLGNPMDRGACQATVHRVVKSLTQFKHWVHTHAISLLNKQTKKYQILLPEKDGITLIQVTFGRRELQFLTSFEEPYVIIQLTFTEHLCCESNCTRLHQFSSVTQSCPTLCDPKACSTPGFPVHHQLPELAQTHVNPVGDAIQPSHPLSIPSLPAFNLSQHQALCQ